MTEYPLDLDAGQIVHWLMDESSAMRRKKLDVRATREYATEPVAHPGEVGVGEDEEVATLTTVGVLEVRPLDAAHSWIMRMRVDDVVGSHLPEDESVPEDAEEIDLEAFYRDFIAPDTGTAFVSLSAETAQGKGAFDRLHAQIVADRHGG